MSSFLFYLSTFHIIAHCYIIIKKDQMREDVIHNLGAQESCLHKNTSLSAQNR